MKKLLTILLVLALVFSLCACGKSDKADKPAENNEAAAVEEKVEEAPAEEKAEEAPAVEKAEEPAAEAEPAAEEKPAEEAPAADLSNPDQSVEFGDFKGMNSVADGIQNGDRMTGKVVYIDGVINKVGPNYQIGEKNDAGNFIGTKLVIEGDDPVYPEVGTHVKLTGIISGRAIHVQPDNFEIAE